MGDDKYVGRIWTLGEFRRLTEGMPDDTVLLDTHEFQNGLDRWGRATRDIILYQGVRPARALVRSDYGTGAVVGIAAVNAHFEVEPPGGSNAVLFGWPNEAFILEVER